MDRVDPGPAHEVRKEYGWRVAAPSFIIARADPSPRSGQALKAGATRFFILAEEGRLDGRRDQAR